MIDITKEIYEAWTKFYEKHDKVEYPTLKNFTEKKLKSIMSLHDYHNSR